MLSLQPSAPPSRARRGARPLRAAPASGAGGSARDLAARICLGVVTGAHGVKGLVRIKSFTAEPAAVAAYGPLADESGARRFALTLVGSGKGVLLARIQGIADRDAAERLKGVRLYVRRTDLPPPADDEFYMADLVGLEARLGDGSPLGTVRAAHDFGAGASLEIERDGGKTVLVPFTRAAVPVVDIAAGKITVAPPAGLLDEEPAREGGS